MMMMMAMMMFDNGGEVDTPSLKMIVVEIHISDAVTETSIISIFPFSIFTQSIC